MPGSIHHCITMRFNDLIQAIGRAGAQHRADDGPQEHPPVDRSNGRHEEPHRGCHHDQHAQSHFCQHGIEGRQRLQADRGRVGGNGSFHEWDAFHDEGNPVVVQSSLLP